MRRLVIEFDDDEIEMLEEQFQQIQDTGVFDTLEDYVYYATMTHCKTMKATIQMMNQVGGLDKLISKENVHVGVMNIPVQLQYTNPTNRNHYNNNGNNANNNRFNNRNNGQLN